MRDQILRFLKAIDEALAKEAKPGERLDFCVSRMIGLVESVTLSGHGRRVKARSASEGTGCAPRSLRALTDAHCGVCGGSSPYVPASPRSLSFCSCTPTAL